MDAFLIAFVVVATAEMGDKTQLIALFLASRFRKPVPIILGILAATLANHAATGLVGQWLGSVLHGNLLHGILAVSFFAAAIWAFIPDTIEAGPSGSGSHHSIFLTTFLTFFLAELGDKTQVATAALAAQLQSVVAVVLGTTVGMMAANVPVVLLSHAIAGKISLTLVRALSGILFAGLGLYEVSHLWYGS
jgi:putative Ca2+/H+ antiporter (TMEM165/GDT1 family)